MIEKICNKLTEKIRNKMPEIDNEKAEIINYGLQLVIGEIPKTFVIIAIAYMFKVLELTVLALLFIMPYKTFSGGVHLKTHIGCIIATSLFYIGTAVLSKHIIFEQIYLKYIIIITTWVFSIIMIKLYAPADTENVPILRKKDRDFKRKLSYITMTLTLVCALIVKDSVISNLLIFGTFLQTIFITKFIYKITNNKYGYKEYIKRQNMNVTT
ncbi:MAG: accessory gene regulator B family protein [Clostridia bacterium]|nr:accessory gene regulator B family protein [Clostridia bacterium]